MQKRNIAMKLDKLLDLAWAIAEIEAKALRKLRHPSRSKKLRDYMG